MQRNPIIADVFHRSGLIEKWGRGTNRVGEMCRAAGIAPPEFAEIGGAAVATFRVPVAPSNMGSEPGVESKVESKVESLDAKVLRLLADGELSKAEVARRLGMARITGQLHGCLASLRHRGIIEFTRPDRPGSRLQKYRLARTGKPDDGRGG